MLEKNSKFPKYFQWVLLAISIMTFTFMFFSVKLVAGVYFVALIISAVYFIIDKKYGSSTKHYSKIFFLFELINLMAVIAVWYYEHKVWEIALTISVSLLIFIELVLMLVDFFLVKNYTNKQSYYVNFFKLCSMICILTYFFNVSDLYFAIIAIVFEIINFVIKLYFAGTKQSYSAEVVILDSQEEKIEEMIRNTDIEEGEDIDDI